MTLDEAKHAYDLDYARYWRARAKENLDRAKSDLDRAEKEFIEAAEKVERLETAAPKAGE